MADDIQSKAADLMKKVLTVGVGTIFLTEESLRNLVNEWKLPKELLTGILDSASKTKNDFFSRLSTDALDRFKDKVDVSKLIQEVLSRNEIELSVKVNFRPKETKEKDSG